MCLQRLLRFLVILSLIGNFSATKLPVFLRPDDHAPANLCENFYAYSCNTWLAQTKKPQFEPIWNPWIAANHKIKQRLSKILLRHDPSLIKPQIFYRWCLRIVEHEDKYLQELVSLVKSVGGWPLIDHALTKTRDWFKQLVSVTSLLGIHPIVKIRVDLDYQDTNRVVYVEAGDLIFPQYILTGSGYSTELEAYEKWVMDTASHLSNSHVIDSGDVKEIIKFEINLAKAMGVHGRHERTTVGKLSKKIPVDWRWALYHLFPNMNITSNTSIAIHNYAALKNIFLLVDRTDKKIVANYIIWSLIKDMSRETTNHMRDLNFLIDQAILGVKDDLTREYECLDAIIKYFSPLLVPPYLKMYSNPRVFRKAESMFESIRGRFIHTLTDSDWLSKEAKVSTVEKVKNIKLNLGFPPDILNGTFEYRKLQMTSDHFTNVLKLKKFKMEQELRKNSWPSSPFDVNAYYSVLQNSIFIPLGLLEPPFFHPNRPDSPNYGALGFLMGHEMSHALDPMGIHADPSGKIKKWLPENDLANYKNRTLCFGNGTTVGENMADSNGLRLSLEALNENSGDKKEFFVSFAQMWCEISENTEIFLGEEHASNGDRVLSLINNEDFRKTFNCSGSSCDLW